MGQSTFNLISNIMRYWFAGLIILITVRLFISVMQQSSKERAVAKKQTQQYQMGLLEIIQPRENKKIYGQRFVLHRENTIGRSNQCDIQIQEKSVRPIQAMIFQKGNQILIRSMENKTGVYLNGERVEGDVPLLDGDEIELSNVLVRLSLRGQGGKRSSQKKEKASPWNALPQDFEEDFEEDEEFYDEGEFDDDAYYEEDTDSQPFHDDEENTYYDDEDIYDNMDDYLEDDEEAFYDDEENDDHNYWDDEIDNDEMNHDDEKSFRHWQRRRK